MKFGGLILDRPPSLSLYLRPMIF